MARSVARDHGTKRHAILRGAARLFAEEGYGLASMAQVAARCGVSKGTLYHYYDGKEALLFDILDTHLRALRDRLRALPHDDPDPAAQLRAIVGALLTAYEGADAEHAVQLNALAALPEPKREPLRAHQREMVAAVRARIEALAPRLATEPGRLRAVTMSVFAMVNWHYQWAGTASAHERAAYADVVTGLVTGGLPALRDPPRP